MLRRTLRQALERRRVLALIAAVVPWQHASRNITPSMSLGGDLGIDSLGKVALLHRIEKELRIDLGEERNDLSHVDTVQDILDLTRRPNAASSV